MHGDKGTQRQEQGERHSHCAPGIRRYGAGGKPSFLAVEHWAHREEGRGFGGWEVKRFFSSTLSYLFIMLTFRDCLYIVRSVMEM